MSYKTRATIEEAIDIIKSGGMVILCDDEDRENEGDLVIASQFVTPEVINFMATYGRGLICISLTGQRCDKLNLPLLTSDNNSRFGTAFTVSIEAKEGVTTGISAYDRAKTIQTAIDETSTAHSLARPGHIFPLRYKDGGVLCREGQTEGSVDLARLAGLYPSGVICEIMDDDGSMARMPSLEKFAETHKLKIVTIADIIKYRLEHEDIIEMTETAKMPTAYGDFTITGFRNKADGREAAALVKGNITDEETVLVRVHTQCLTGDIFVSNNCDCESKLHNAMKEIDKEGKGVVLYLYQDTSKSGFLSTPEGEIRPHIHKERQHKDYGFGAMILKKLGLKKIKLLSSSHKIMKCISAYGLEIE